MDHEDPKLGTNCVAIRYIFLRESHRLHLTEKELTQNSLQTLTIIYR